MGGGNARRESQEGGTSHKKSPGARVNERCVCRSKTPIHLGLEALGLWEQYELFKEQQEGPGNFHDGP